MTPWARVLRRVASMSGHELSTRLRQAACQRADALRHRAGLPPAQPSGKVPLAGGHFFFATGDAPKLAECWRKFRPADAQETVKRAEQILTRRYPLLGYAPLDFGDPVDWQLDPAHGRRSPLAPFHTVPYLNFERVGDHKIVWELSRHQHLLTLVRAWLFSGERRFVEEALAQWRHWISANPYPLGINWTSTLEVAFRILSWMWMDHMLADSEFSSSALRSEFARAIGQGAWYIRRYLSTYFAPNTHLLGEAYALFAAGVLYPGFDNATRWATEGWAVVNQEAHKQVRPDGFHFEQSTYYHVYALDFFLHARMLGARNGFETAELDAVIQRMTDALAAISQAGITPRFGDDDGGRLFDPARNRTPYLLDPVATAAVLYSNAQWKARSRSLPEEAVWLLGADVSKRWEALATREAPPQTVLFRESGYVCMAQGSAVAVVDVGPHGFGNGGHGHADALSLQLLSQGEALLTDPGTAFYPFEKAERNEFRNTAAHSTLEVDGAGQAEPVGSFRWEKMPVVTIERWHAGDRASLLVARHNGYERLADPVIHQRSIVSWQGSGWLIRDLALAGAGHRYKLRWQLPPATKVTAAEAGVALSYASGQVLQAGSAAPNASWDWKEAAAAWSPAYGAVEPASQLILSATVEGTAEVATVLALGADRMRLACLAESSGVTVYGWSDAGSVRRLWFSNRAGSWECRGVRSDAAFIAVETVDGRIEAFCIAGARSLAVNGTTIFDCAQAVDWWEWQPGSEPRVEEWNPAALADLNASVPYV